MEENKEVEIVKEEKEEEKVQVEIVDKKDDEIPEKEESVEEDRLEDGDEKEDEEKESSVSSLLEEREEGDGEEEKDKKLDDDEDKRNPQYIPKKGNFYEHDDRMGEDEAVAEPAKVEEEGKEKKKKGKVWEEVERWGHDMYNESEQSPKSTRELIDAYGYDIRSEEGPPKARRRRRYGKGQNKYQRSWEDESAYVKTNSSYRGRKPREFVKKDEDFPELSGKRDSTKTEAKVTKKVQISDEVTEIDERREGKARSPPFRGGRGGGGRGGNYSGRGRFNKPGTGRVQPSTPPNANRMKKSDQDDIATLAQHFSEAVINIDKNIIPRVAPKDEDKNKSSKADNPRKVIAALPQLQVAQENRPKRYSAQRQRSLPQSSSTHSSQQSPQPFIQQTQPQQAIQHANYYQAPPPQQQHVEQPPVTQNYPGMQMVTFLPPPPHPPPAQPAYAAQPPPIYVPQQFIASPPPLAVQPPTEVYQGGGITYYSTQTQMANHAQLPRRVNLAIPIVHPGEQSEP